MQTCTISGCDKAHRAKGLCSTHYNQQMPERHKKVTLTCAGCSSHVVKDVGRDNRYANVYCSSMCRNAHRSLVAKRAKQVVAVYHPAPLLVRAVAILPSRPRHRVFAGGTCRVCGATFLCLFGSLTCSAECQREAHRALGREHRHRYRARLRGAYRAPVFRTAIYVRDEWICQLCHEPIDRTQSRSQPLAPTIDHVIPLSKGGTHEPNNVQCAHFICNSIKGDRTYVLRTALAC